MNVQTMLTDTEILQRLHLVATLEPGQKHQLCFACEKPIAQRSHYRITVTGASGAPMGIQICVSCHRPLYREAYDRKHAPKATTPVVLTAQEAQLAPPAPLHISEDLFDAL